MKYALLNNSVRVHIYNSSKYERGSKEIANCVFNDAVAFEVLTGEKAEELEKEIDNASIDEYHEYLALYLEDGTVCHFRNSHADLMSY
jgi:hypothetical protein